jgi:phosphoribosylanthranilate isomerase
MTDGYMNKFDTMVGIIVMVMVIVSSVLFVKCEDNKYNHCKYVIIDSHKYKYHAISYKVIDNTCISMINEDHKRIIICGEYTIEETN